MKMQLAVALAAVLGLSGCGGGGSGGGSDEPDRSGTPTTPETPSNPDGPAPDTSVSTLHLAGTWMWATTTYGAADANDEREWLNTRRQTFVITRVNSSVLRFKDCVADSNADWTLASGIVSRSSQASLTVVDANTMVATSGNGATQIELVRLSQDQTPQLELVLPLDRNTWNQLCAETVVADGATNNVQLRAAGTEGLVTAMVKMNFESSTYFTPQVYWYPGSGDVFGSYAVTGLGSGNLANPNGNMTLSEVGGVYDFAVNVEMDIQETSSSVSILGNLKLHSDWLAAPEEATAQ